MAGALWRVREHLIRYMSVVDHVLAHLQRHLRRTGERGHVGHIHLVELLHPGDDPVQLLLHARNFVIVQMDARKPGNTANGRGIERHRQSLDGRERGTITAGMALFNLRELRAALRPDERLIGLDPGAKTIGIALSDVALMLASPYGSIRRGRLLANADAILAIARKEGVGGLVVGLPLSLDGTLGPAAQSARDWALALSDATALPAALWDERLSSAAVERLLVREADLGRRRRAQVIDRMAAAYMLQSALDASR